jgi:hypothetical protein
MELLRFNDCVWENRSNLPSDSTAVGEILWTEKRWTDCVLLLDKDTDADRNGAVPSHECGTHFQGFELDSIKDMFQKVPFNLEVCSSSRGKVQQSFANCHDNLFTLGSLDDWLASACNPPCLKSRERSISNLADNCQCGIHRLHTVS